MQNIIIFTVILASASAIPVFLQDQYLRVPVAKTIVHSTQLVDQGSTYHALPVIHTVEPLKKTVTSSSQVVNHGGTAVLHTPVHYAVSVPVKSHVQEFGALVHPVVHSPVVYHPSVVQTGDSAVSHHSSTVHETIPMVNSLPLYSIHH